MGCFRSVWTLCCLGLVTARPAGGAEPDLEIVVSCAELSPERADELTARIRLLVYSAPAPRPDRLHVECRQGQGQVLGRWSGQARAQTFEDAASDIEPVLNAVDDHLLKGDQVRARNAATSAAPGPASTIHAGRRKWNCGKWKKSV